MCAHGGVVLGDEVEDHVLLDLAVEAGGAGAAGEDGHVFAAVAFALERDRRFLQVVGVFGVHVGEVGAAVLGRADAAVAVWVLLRAFGLAVAGAGDLPGFFGPPIS